MHQPDNTPRPSIFYDYRVHPFAAPPELEGRRKRHPVVVVGAGPIGLAIALDLARYGVACVLVTADQQVSHGSRALVYTRRSMEILQQVGVAQRIAQHLGVDRRTIHRQLARNGCTFSRLVDDVREEIVTGTLASPRRPLSDVSELLGFSAQSAFSRWFRARFGCSASSGASSRGSW